jgi:CRISP-associated protein Cas1
VYDLMEPFRWLVDLTVVELVETKAIESVDFQTDADYRVSLRELAAHRVVERLSQNFNRMVRVEGSRMKVDTVVDMECRRLARFLLRRTSGIDLSFPMAADSTKAETELVQRLMNLTAEDRKQLGIPKTTYHCIRRNLLAGRPIRVYKKVLQRLPRAGSGGEET